MIRFKKILCLLAAFALTVTFLSGCKNDDSKNANTANSDSAAVQEPAVESDDILIQTEYGTLYFPAVWKDSFSYEITEGEPYTVKFLGQITGENPTELFSVVFGEQGDILMGKITGDKACNVYVSPAVDTDESWTDEELTFFQAMQEEMNYTLNKLSEIDSFENAQ